MKLIITTDDGTAYALDTTVERPVITAQERTELLNVLADATHLLTQNHLTAASIRSDISAIVTRIRTYARPNFEAAIEAAISCAAQFISTLHKSPASTCSRTERLSDFPDSRGMCDMPADSF